MTVKVAVPNTPDDLRETLLNQTKLKTLIEQGDFPTFMTNYQAEFGKASPETSENVQEQIDRALASFAQEHAVEFRRGGKNGRKLSYADVRRDERVEQQSAAKWSADAQGAVLDGKFANLKEFLNLIDHRVDPREPGIADQRKAIKNAMSSTDPGSGGFLIPEEFRAELLRVALETAVVRPRARVIPMGSLRSSMPGIDTTTNSGSVYGGIIAYWTEEGAALVQSQPAFQRVVLEAKKLTAYTEVPNELRQDSGISVDAFIDTIYPEAIAWFEDIAFLRGTGVGEPFGVLHASNSALVAAAKESGQLADTIYWENLVGMYARMLPSSLNKAVWVVAPDTFPQLATMALSVGTGGSAVWLNMGVEGPPATILGRPVIISEKASKLGDQGDVNFIDFSQYLIGDRMAMSAETSEHYKFGNDMYAYRFIERVDGRPWMQSAVTPQNGSASTLSPYVSLAERA